MQEPKQEQQQQKEKERSEILTDRFSKYQRQEIYPVTEGIKSRHTLLSYRRNFNHFLDHLKIHDLQVLLDYNPKIVESFIIDYIKHLRDMEKLSHMSIQVHLASIFHFFDMNDFDISSRSKMKIKRFLPPDERSSRIGSNNTADRPYRTQEIARILSKCDERSSVIIHLMTSTGMRIGAIHTLTIGDLTEVRYNQHLKLYKIQVYSMSKKDRYYAFCTPECASAIDSYLDYRRRFKEEIKVKSPLIREQFNIEDHLRIQNPRFLSRKTIEHLLDQALTRSGVKSSEAARSHAFRKGFMSTCERTGMKSINVKMLLGHNIGVSGHYYRPAESDILEDYMTHAADALTISDEHRLKKQVQQLESKHSSEWGELKEEVRQLKELIDYIGFGDSRDMRIQKQKRLLNQLQQLTGYEVQKEDYEKENGLDG